METEGNGWGGRGLGVWLPGPSEYGRRAADRWKGNGVTGLGLSSLQARLQQTSSTPPPRFGHNTICKSAYLDVNSHPPPSPPRHPQNCVPMTHKIPGSGGPPQIILTSTDALRNKSWAAPFFKFKMADLLKPTFCSNFDMQGAVRYCIQHLYGFVKRNSGPTPFSKKAMPLKLDFLQRKNILERNASTSALALANVFHELLIDFTIGQFCFLFFFQALSNHSGILILIK